jgi:hypothetical protein
VRKPWKGCLSRWPRVTAEQVVAERKSIDTLRRRTAGSQPGVEAREGRLGEILAKAFVAGPRRAKPKGASSGGRANSAFVRQGLLEGSKPRNRGLSSRPVPSGTGIPTGETVGGFF